MSIHRFRGTLKAGFALAAGISTAVCQSNNTRIFEAEDAVLSGTEVDTATAGFSGEFRSLSIRRSPYERLFRF